MKTILRILDIILDTAVLIYVWVKGTDAAFAGDLTHALMCIVSYAVYAIYMRFARFGNDWEKLKKVIVRIDK